jgi:SPP1 family predicted phage head-tail adaptor
MDVKDFGSGKLNRLVTIKLWSDVPDAEFAITPTYDAGHKVFAAHLPVGTATMALAMQIGEKVTDKFVVRFRAGVIESHLITNNHVVEKNGLRYRVKGTSPLEGGREFVVIDTEMLGII